MSTIRTTLRPHRLLLLTVALLLAVPFTTPALAHGPATHGPGERGQAIGRLDPGLGAQLAQVRAATARYHDVEVAIADGFMLPPESHCVEGPAGAMGYHYVNLARIGQLDPTMPQVLLYLPDADGRLRLVGVEYLSPAPGAALFGQPFMDFSPPFGPETALHVWLWQANPAGMFAPYNPHLRCPSD
jgi:hypothetical protein